MSDVARTGAARRRRERRLRSWLRHERMTVAAELAAALHHSRDGERETNNVPRGQTTARSGTRPGVFKEREAQEAAVTVGCVAAGAPLLGVPSLAAAAADGVHGTTASVLLRLALKKKKEKDEEERRKVVEKGQRQREFSSLLAVPRELRTPA